MYIKGGCQHCQYEAAVASVQALQMQFMTHGDILERVEAIKYLGHLVTVDGEGKQAINANITKAWHAVACLIKALQGENAEPGTCAQVYWATVQAMLLFSAATWNLTPSALKKLEEFHTRCTWRTNHIYKPQKGRDSDWRYPLVKDMLEEAGLKTMERYTKLRCDTVVIWIVNWPIYSAFEKENGSIGPTTRSGASSPWGLS